jgi:transcriptional regulator with XRE-family HTH domain
MRGMSIDATISTLREWMSSSGLSRRQIGRLAGINDRTIKHYTNPDWSPHSRTLRKLEAARQKHLAVLANGHDVAGPELIQSGHTADPGCSPGGPEAS